MENTTHQDLIKTNVARLYSNLFELVGDFNIGSNLRQFADSATNWNTFHYRIQLISRKAYNALKFSYEEGKEAGVDFGLYESKIEAILNDKYIKEYITI